MCLNLGVHHSPYCCPFVTLLSSLSLLSNNIFAFPLGCGRRQDSNAVFVVQRSAENLVNPSETTWMALGVGFCTSGRRIRSCVDVTVGGDIFLCGQNRRSRYWRFSAGVRNTVGSSKESVLELSWVLNTASALKLVSRVGTGAGVVLDL